MPHHPAASAPAPRTAQPDASIPAASQPQKGARLLDLKHCFAIALPSPSANHPPTPSVCADPCLAEASASGAGSAVGHAKHPQASRPTDAPAPNLSSSSSSSSSSLTSSAAPSRLHRDAATAAPSQAMGAALVPSASSSSSKLPGGAPRANRAHAHSSPSCVEIVLPSRPAPAASPRQEQIARKRLSHTPPIAPPRSGQASTSSLRRDHPPRASVVAVVVPRPASRPKDLAALATPLKPSDAKAARPLNRPAASMRTAPSLSMPPQPVPLDKPKPKAVPLPDPIFFDVPLPKASTTPAVAHRQDFDSSADDSEREQRGRRRLRERKTQPSYYIPRLDEDPDYSDPRFVRPAAPTVAATSSDRASEPAEIFPVVLYPPELCRPQKVDRSTLVPPPPLEAAMAQPYVVRRDGDGNETRTLRTIELRDYWTFYLDSSAPDLGPSSGTGSLAVAKPPGIRTLPDRDHEAPPVPSSTAATSIANLLGRTWLERVQRPLSKPRLEKLLAIASNQATLPQPSSQSDPASSPPQSQPPRKSTEKLFSEIVWPPNPRRQAQNEILELARDEEREEEDRLDNYIRRMKMLAMYEQWQSIHDMVDRHPLLPLTPSAETSLTLPSRLAAAVAVATLPADPIAASSEAASLLSKKRGRSVDEDLDAADGLGGQNGWTGGQDGQAPQGATPTSASGAGDPDRLPEQKRQRVDAPTEVRGVLESPAVVDVASASSTKQTEASAPVWPTADPTDADEAWVRAMLVVDGGEPWPPVAASQGASGIKGVGQWYQPRPEAIGEDEEMAEAASIGASAAEEPRRDETADAATDAATQTVAEDIADANEVSDALAVPQPVQEPPSQVSVSSTVTEPTGWTGVSQWYTYKSKEPVVQSKVDRFFQKKPRPQEQPNGDGPASGSGATAVADIGKGPIGLANGSRALRRRSSSPNDVPLFLGPVSPAQEGDADQGQPLAAGPVQGPEGRASPILVDSDSDNGVGQRQPPAEASDAQQENGSAPGEVSKPKAAAKDAGVSEGPPVATTRTQLPPSEPLFLGDDDSDDGGILGWEASDEPAAGRNLPGPSNAAASPDLSAPSWALTSASTASTARVAAAAKAGPARVGPSAADIIIIDSEAPSVCTVPSSPLPTRAEQRATAAASTAAVSEAVAVVSISDESEEDELASSHSASSSASVEVEEVQPSIRELSNWYSSSDPMQPAVYSRNRRRREARKQQRLQERERERERSRHRNRSSQPAQRKPSVEVLDLTLDSD